MKSYKKCIEILLGQEPVKLLPRLYHQTASSYINIQMFEYKNFSPWKECLIWYCTVQLYFYPFLLMYETLIFLISVHLSKSFDYI